MVDGNIDDDDDSLAQSLSHVLALFLRCGMLSSPREPSKRLGEEASERDLG